MECLRQLRGIFFGYEINVFSYNNNLVYDTTLSESQRVLSWRIIIIEFGPNIQHLAGVDNIVAYMLSKFLSMPSNKYKSCTRKDKYCANE